jgi:hypothetical protein
MYGGQKKYEISDDVQSTWEMERSDCNFLGFDALQEDPEAGIHFLFSGPTMVTLVPLFSLQLRAFQSFHTN